MAHIIALIYIARLRHWSRLCGLGQHSRMEEDEGRCGETAVAQDAPRSPEFTREKEGVYKGHSGREEEEVNMYRGIDQSSRRACGQNARRNEMKNWDHTW